MDELIIETMKLKDVEEVAKIERVSYSSPWPVHAFANEIMGNRLAYYIVARYPKNKKIVGYAGMWLIMEEAHITNLAVHPDFRRRGIGEKLLITLIKKAIKRKIKWMTLEVRESNKVAQHLYAKYQFKLIGVHKGYYLDNNENAIIMWSENLQDTNFLSWFRQKFLKQE